ncbi:MAG TPA: Abi family protein [Luteolibacter sp.]
MEYQKPPLTFEEQAGQLLARGLDADKEELIHRLAGVNYYRLSGYLFPFRQNGSDDFVPGTSLQTVWRRYCFDRRLRVLTLDAIERIEVAVRTRLVYTFTHRHGPFGHLDDQNLPKLKIGDYLEWRLKLQEETARSKETFRKAFFEKYGDHHKELPLWMLCELMSMGSLLTFLKGVEPSIVSEVGKPWHLPDELLLSWLGCLYATRNICAHHARFWNRELGFQPKLPNRNKFPDWHGDAKPRTNRCGIILLICRHWLGMISPSSSWHRRVEDLFAEYPDVPLADMGMTDAWTQHPVWISARPTYPSRPSP